MFIRIIIQHILSTLKKRKQITQKIVCLWKQPISDVNATSLSDWRSARLQSVYHPTAELQLHVELESPSEEEVCGRKYTFIYLFTRLRGVKSPVPVVGTRCTFNLIHCNWLVVFKDRFVVLFWTKERSRAHCPGLFSLAVLEVIDLENDFMWPFHRVLLF